MSTSTTLPWHTAADLDRLQSWLDASYAAAGDHLAEIHTDAARLTAAELVRRLPSMQVMVVATTSRDGRPFTGPVDAFLHAGRVHFGTSPRAVRARHLAERPAVSVTWADDEATVLTVHGRARLLDLRGEAADFGERVRSHYGGALGDWDEWLDNATYLAVDPDRVFAADMSVHTAG